MTEFWRGRRERAALYINRNYKSVKCGARYEEVRELLFEAVYEGRTVYVIDKAGYYEGCIGKTELKKCEIENRLVVNKNSKSIVHSEREEEIAQNICRENQKIRNIPVTDEKGILLYEICYENKDKNDMIVEELRNKGLIIGQNVNIHNCNIDYTWGWLISIGSHVTLTHTTVLAHDASTNLTLGKTKLGKVSIGDYVFVGYSIILPNVKLGNRVIVGAGTVVSKDIPDNSVVVGNPMRVIGTYEEYIEKHRKNMENGIVYDVNPNDLTQEDKRRMLGEIEGIAYIN